MFLINLQIHNEEELIRNIPFNKGINLIVDETPLQTELKDKTISGNNVGKTTVLRLIDFCLAGNGENIYTGSEFKSANQKIKTFLTDNNIIITLTLSESYEDIENSVIIKRNFLSYSKKIQTINDKKYNNDEFPIELTRLIFKTNVTKPTFKQLKSKNIRDEKNKLVNTIKVLTPYDTKAAYEALHLFWFGITMPKSKDVLVTERNAEKKHRKILRKMSTYSSSKQAIKALEKKINELKIKKNIYNINDSLHDELSILSKIKLNMSENTSIVSRLETRRNLILESLGTLEGERVHIDTEQIKVLYKRAKSLVPSLQKSFEDLTQFHNKMIDKKISFISEELPAIEREINSKRKHLNALIIRQKNLSTSVNNSGTAIEFENIVNELALLSERKGEFVQKNKQWKLSDKNLKDIEEQIDNINDSMSSKSNLITQRVTEFNEIFSDISSKLDSSLSVLSADNDTEDKIYEFKIENVEGNLGTGSKKSQMAAFDIAYIKFADMNQIPCLHFILQDQIENVHSNQITNLLKNVIEEANCQYVIPILRDKLPSTIETLSLEILSLSQDDKLFCIK